MKKNIWIVLLIALVAAVWAESALATSSGESGESGEGRIIVNSGKCGYNLWYSLDNEGVLVIEGTGSMEDYDLSDYSGDGIPTSPWGQEIREVILKNGITTIGNYAFSKCAQLDSISIPDSLTSIGEYSFDDCSHLMSISIPNSVSDIGAFAFTNCSSLTNISIPYGIDSIGDSLFNGCSSLILVNIPDSVTSIGRAAFQRCSQLMYVTIPRNVTSLGEGAFYGCSSLTDISIPDGVTLIDRSTFSDCSNLSSISLPDSITDIGEFAFYHCSKLNSIVIPENVRSIGGSAFDGCSALTSISIPNKVTIINRATFLLCTNLSSISIPNGITAINELAFLGCSNLSSITIPENTTYIGDNAFGYCSNLEKITIYAKLTTFGTTICSNGMSPTIYCYAGSDAETWANNNGYAIGGNPDYSSANLSATLKKGSSGTQVTLLTTRLIELGYLTGSPTSYYSDAVVNAVMWFQNSNSLGPDGIAGRLTLQKIYSQNIFDACESMKGKPDTVPSQMNGTINKPSISGIQALAWSNDTYFNRKTGVFKDGATATVTDVKTGITYKVKRKGGYNHADVEPLTAYDTWQMFRIYNQEWAWDRHAVVVTFSNGVSSAASINGMPHGVSSITDNNMDGHTCLYFSGSLTHGTNYLDPTHQAAVSQAAQANLSELQNKINFQFNGGSAIYLPASTTIIEEEAFASTSADIYVLPAGISAIASRAFADLQHPALVVIPTSADIDIAPDAFAGSSVTIECPAGSPVEAWAAANGIPTVNP